MMLISRKLTGGFLLIALLTLIIGFLGINVTRSIDREFRAVADGTLPMIQMLERIRFAGLRIVSSTSEFVLLMNEKQNVTGPKEETGEEEVLIGSGKALFDGTMAQYEVLRGQLHPHEDSLLAEIAKHFKLLEQTSMEIIAAKKAGIAGEAILQLKERFEEQEKYFLQQVDASIQHKYGELETRKESIFVLSHDAICNILIVTLLMFLASVLLGGRISRSISLPLERLSRATCDIGLGRLNTRIAHPRPSLHSREQDEIEITISNFNRMAEELAQTTVNRGYLDSIVESLGQSLLVTSSQGRIIHGSHSACNLLGYPREELVGSMATVLCPDIETLNCDSSDADTTPRIERAEFVHKDGKKFAVQVALSTLKNEYGSKEGCILVFQNAAA